MKQLRLILAIFSLTLASAVAQIHYTPKMTPPHTGTSYVGPMTPVHTGQPTPYTGRTTPVYTGRSTPYTGRPIPQRASKSRASIRRSGNRSRVTRTPLMPNHHTTPLPPSVGDTVNTLPLRYKTAYYRGYYYYYGNGYYYRGSTSPLVSPYSLNYGEKRPKKRKKKAAKKKTFTPTVAQESFQVVAPPVGLIVDDLPVGARQVKKGLYQHRETHYRPTYSDGKVKYIVSKF